MNAWMERANGWGAEWVEWAWAAGLQSGVLMLVVLGLARLLRGRVNPVWVHALWMLVLVKLVLPPALSLPTGLGYSLRDRIRWDLVQSA